jgi:hypothetical protein
MIRIKGLTVLHQNLAPGPYPPSMTRKRQPEGARRVAQRDGRKRGLFTADSARKRAVASVLHARAATRGMAASGQFPERAASR